MVLSSRASFVEKFFFKFFSSFWEGFVSLLRVRRSILSLCRSLLRVCGSLLRDFGVFEGAIVFLWVCESLLRV